MYDSEHTGTEWVEGLFLIAGVLWIVGALLAGSLAMMGAARFGDGSVSAASNQTPVAESNNTPTTEDVQTVDVPAGQAPEGETPAMAPATP